MVKNKLLQDCLQGRQGSYLMPFLWYAGESAATVEKTIEAIHSSGIKEVTFENRGGNWFATDRFWKVLKAALDKCEKLGMRLWMLDDSHVGTGSANDTMMLAKNAKYRARNLRIDLLDIAGPIAGASVLVPKHTDKEEVLEVVAFRRDETTGKACGKPIVLTDRITDDLVVPIDFPDGVWRVYFIMTTDPSRQGIFANYITMVSKESCRHLIDEVHEKVYAHLGKYFGKTFAGFFSDEPAFGNCNGEYDFECKMHRMGQIQRFYPWWDGVLERLAKEVKMPVEKVWQYLPALWDEVDGISPKLRVGYMDVITKLWEENFSCQIGKWCEAHGVQYMGHNLEDDSAHFHTGFGCGHYFRSMGGQHFAGLDVVLTQMIPGITTIKHGGNCGTNHIINNQFYHYTLAKLGASLAHHNPTAAGRSVCEVMGAYGWSSGLACLRYIFNFFMAHGINHYVPHAFSMVPPLCFKTTDERTDFNADTLPPGYTLTYMAPTFYASGLNPQYRQFKEIVGHVQRTCHLISKGTHRPDVAVHYSAEPDWIGCKVQPFDQVNETLTRGGFDFDILSTDMLFSRCRVKDGRLLSDGESYGALIFPMSELFPRRILAKVQKFAAAGLPVIFADALPIGCDRPGEDISALLKGIQTIPTVKLVAALEKICGRHLRFTKPDPELRFQCLAQADGTEVCLFFNESRHVIDTAVSRPIPGDCVLYDPWLNQCFRAPAAKGGVRLKLEPFQLLVLIFGDNASGLPAFSCASPALAPLPLKYDIYMQDVTGDGNWKLLHKKSPAINLTVADKLTRACAGYRYEASFNCSEPSATRLAIPGGGDCAELWLNGEYCGTQIGPVLKFDISGKLRKGKNTIVIQTADNPCYADRTPEHAFSADLSSKFPLPVHGFVGDILIG